MRLLSLLGLTAALLTLTALAGALTSSDQNHCTAWVSKNCTALPPPRSPLPDCGTSASLNRSDTLIFGIIGDYGWASQGCEQNAVALLRALEKQMGTVCYSYVREYVLVSLLLSVSVRQSGPLDFVMTAGDNNYWTGSCESIQENIGRFDRWPFLCHVCSAGRSHSMRTVSLVTSSQLAPASIQVLTPAKVSAFARLLSCCFP